MPANVDVTPRADGCCTGADPNEPNGSADGCDGAPPNDPNAFEAGCGAGADPNEPKALDCG